MFIKGTSLCKASKLVMKYSVAAAILILTVHILYQIAVFDIERTQSPFERRVHFPTTNRQEDRPIMVDDNPTTEGTQKAPVPGGRDINVRIITKKAKTKPRSESDIPLVNNVSYSHRVKLLSNLTAMKALVGSDGLPVVLNRPYLIENRTLCSTNDRISLAVIVVTAFPNFAKRQLVRQTWNNQSFVNSGLVRLIFLLGRTNNSMLQNRLQKESDVYGDILQGDFVDTYHNLTNKGVMAYKWLTERCTTAEFVLKIDDDVLVNSVNVVDVILPYLKDRRRTVMCYIARSHKIFRNVTDKWYVTPNQFPGKKVYPEYCSGFFVLLTGDLIPFLYEAAKTTPFFWIEDVYLHGLLLSRVPGSKRILPPVSRECKNIGVCLLLWQKPTNSSIIAVPDLSHRQITNRRPYLSGSPYKYGMKANSSKVHVSN